MLQRLRKRLSSLSLRSTSRSEKKEDKDADDDEQEREHDPLHVPELQVTTGSGSPAASAARTAPPSPVPALRLSTPSSSATSPSPASSNPPPSPSLAPSSPRAGRRLKPTPSPPPSPSIRECPWRERRLSSRAVPASIVHSYKPGPPPKPRSKTKLTALPPELLLAIFAYLQGDPTRQANVEYRGASDDRDRWYSHDWSLMQVSKTCRYLRNIAGPILYARAALLHKGDFVKVARLPERVRGRIRHLTVSITALEELYVHLTVLALSTPSSPSPAVISLGAFPDIRLSSPHTSPFPSLASTPIKKPYLRGTPFAPFFAPTQLISLTLFRPRGTSTRSGDAVLPGFAEFFLHGVLGYWRELEMLRVRDERGVWPVLGDVTSGVDCVDMTSMRTLEWDVALLPPPLRLGDALRALTLGEQHVLSQSLPAGLRSLKTRAAVPDAVPDSLDTLHVLPPAGLAPRALRELNLPRLAALRDLRLALASLAALEALVLPLGLRVLHLHLPTLPSSSALTRILEHHTQMLVLSLVLPAPLARSPAPTRAICETDSTHAAHLPLARTLLETARTLREVHVGTRDSEACVWGRPSWITGREAGEEDVVWRGVGERTLLD